MTSRARQEVRRCQDRWLALPATVRRELPGSPGSAGRESLAASAAQAVAGIRQLRRELQAGGDVQTERQLAAIAQRIAGLAEASADLRSGAGQETCRGMRTGQRVPGRRPGHPASDRRARADRPDQPMAASWSLRSSAAPGHLLGRPVISPPTVSPSTRSPWPGRHPAAGSRWTSPSSAKGPAHSRPPRRGTWPGSAFCGRSARPLAGSRPAPASRQLTTGSFLRPGRSAPAGAGTRLARPVREHDRPGRVRSLHPQAQHPVAGLAAGREKEAAG